MSVGAYDIPKCWPTEKLDRCLLLIRNGTSKKQNRDKKGVAVTRIETISQDCIDLERVGYVDGLGENEIEQYRLQSGDILLSHINSEPQLGRTALYMGHPPVLVHGMNLLLLRVNDRIYARFLFTSYSPIFVCEASSLPWQGEPLGRAQ